MCMILVGLDLPNLVEALECLVSLRNKWDERGTTSNRFGVDFYNIGNFKNIQSIKLVVVVDNFPFMDTIIGFFNNAYLLCNIRNDRGN